MANSPSSKKRARQTERRTEVNKARRSRIRTFIRKVEEAIAGGDKWPTMYYWAYLALRLGGPQLFQDTFSGPFFQSCVN